MDQQPPVPTSVSEVESLILALYNPGTAHTAIPAIQDTLLRLQKSPEGWRLAQALLDRPVLNAGDDQIKFFGALTIIVKLNTESSALSDDDARELLQNLVRWLISSANDAAGILSTQKLVHTLVTFYLYFSHLWPNCVRHLLLCLRTGQSTPPPEDVKQMPSVADIVTGLDWRALRVAFWFLNTSVTDVGKTDSANSQSMPVHQRLQANVEDVTALVHCGLTGQVSDPAQKASIQRESIKSIQAWILYAQRVWNGKSFNFYFRTLVDAIVACLQDSELYEVTVELLIDTMTNYSRFFSDAQYRTIMAVFTSPWGEEHLKQLLDGDFDFEPLQYGLMMLAFGDARVHMLVQCQDEHYLAMLNRMTLLVSAKGYPVAEDLLFVPALEFWATYAETMIDTMYSSTDDEDNDQSWIAQDLAAITKVVGHCWQKIQYPPPKELLSWDASDRSGFSNARKDVADLLQTVFTVAGRDMLSMFTDLLLRSITDQAWPQIEATAYCLAALSECISDDDSYDDLLDRVFSSPLFGLLSLGEAQLPVRLRQTALSLIEQYSEYFERHAAQLPAALTLLFDAVATPSLAAQASKAIATLCSSCRLLLTSEVRAFLQQYHLLHGNPQLDPLAEERVVYAIAALVQATADEEARLALVGELLSCILGDVEQALKVQMSLAEGGNSSGLDPNGPLVAKALRQCEQLQLQQQQQQRDEGTSTSAHAAWDPTAVPPAELVLQMVLIPLRCLAGMARGLQSTTEQQVIDVDKNGSGSNGDDGSGGVQAERARQLLALQNTVLVMLVSVQTSFAKSSEVVEVLCSILRAGFSETEPGLFVFPPYMVTELFVRQNAQTTPYIGMLVNTAQAFVSSLRTAVGRGAARGQEEEQGRQQSRKTLVTWVLGLLQAQANEMDDPELTQRGIEFIDRVMQKDAATLLRHEPAAQLEFFFLCTLRVLGGNEPLPKAAAADFWTTFLAFRPSGDDGSDDAALAAMVGTVMEHLGPMLAQTLVNNVGGQASRSELDKLSEPLRKLLVYGVRSQAWIEQALTSPSFPSDRVTNEQKMLFSRKILRLRGGRGTNTVVREFWMACRGTTFEYAS